MTAVRRVLIDLPNIFSTSEVNSAVALIDDTFSIGGIANALRHLCETGVINKRIPGKGKRASVYQKAKIPTGVAPKPKEIKPPKEPKFAGAEVEF